MHDTTRRRLSQITTGAAVISLGLALGLAQPATAEEPDTPQFSAATSSSLLHVSAADLHPLGIDAGPLLNLDLSTTSTSVDSTTPKTEASAAQLDLKTAIPGVELPVRKVTQTAPEDNESPEESSSKIFDLLGLADIGLGKSSALARWNDTTAEGRPHDLTESYTDLADIALLGGIKPSQYGLDDVGTGVIALPNVGKSASSSKITDVPEQHNHGVEAKASIGLKKIVLFGGTEHQLTIDVVSEPTLTGTATGTDKSSVDYTAPILKVTTGKGKEVTIGEVGAAVEIGLDGDIISTETDHDSPALLRLALPDLQKEVTDTSVSAEAASLRLQVLDDPNTGTLLDVALGKLNVEATVPDGGINNPDPKPSKTPGEDDGSGGDKDKSSDELPVTGSATTIIAISGVLFIFAGVAAVKFARRRKAMDV